jgi:hypothetical protein
MMAPVQETPSEWLAFDTIAVSGAPLPGSTTATFSWFPGGDEGPALNGSGSVAFRASTTDGEGIFATDGGVLRTVAHTGASALDTETTFVGFSAPNLNDRGDVAFFAELDGSAGLFAIRDGDLRALARLGDPVPGSGSGETLTAFEGAIPLLNDAGDVAFRGIFDGGQGIFLSRGRRLRVVARTGEPVPDAAAGETFDSFSLPVLNHGRKVAFAAEFGASSGIFVTRGRRLRMVARTGQPVEGETFTGFSRPALNGAGRVAFSATFGASKGVFVPADSSSGPWCARAIRYPVRPKAFSLSPADRP